MHLIYTILGKTFGYVNTYNSKSKQDWKKEKESEYLK